MVEKIIWWTQKLERGSQRKGKERRSAEEKGREKNCEDERKTMKQQKKNGRGECMEDGEKQRERETDGVKGTGNPNEREQVKEMRGRKDKEEEK